MSLSASLASIQQNIDVHETEPTSGILCYRFLFMKSCSVLHSEILHCPHMCVLKQRVVYGATLQCPHLCVIKQRVVLDFDDIALLQELNVFSKFFSMIFQCAPTLGRGCAFRAGASMMSGLFSLIQMLPTVCSRCTWLTLLTMKCLDTSWTFGWYGLCVSQILVFC